MITHGQRLGLGTMHWFAYSNKASGLQDCLRVVKDNSGSLDLHAGQTALQQHQECPVQTQAAPAICLSLPAHMRQQPGPQQLAGCHTSAAG